MCPKTVWFDFEKKVRCAERDTLIELASFVASVWQVFFLSRNLRYVIPKISYFIIFPVSLKKMYGSKYPKNI